MAVTVADVIGPAPFLDRFAVVKKVTFDNSYAGAGGEALTHAQLGFTAAPDYVKVHNNTPSGHLVEYDNTNEKLIAYWNKDPAAAGGADIAFPEVAGTTDLSAVSVYVEAVGYHAAGV